MESIYWVEFSLLLFTGDRKHNNTLDVQDRHSFLPFPWTCLWLKVLRPLCLYSYVLFTVLETLCLDYVVQTIDSFRTLVWLAATSSTLCFKSNLWFLESFIFFSHVCHLQWNTCLWNLLRSREYRMISNANSFERILYNAEGMRHKQDCTVDPARQEIIKK